MTSMATLPSTMSAESPSWQESVSDLISLISSNDADTVKTTGGIEKACVAILERDDAVAGDANAISLPETVRATVATIYLRSLIKLQKYNAVVQYCQRRQKLQLQPTVQQSEGTTNNNNNVEEMAYCLYRMKNYEACSQLCSSASTNGSSSRGMMHIHAQAFYRMGKTTHADAVYRQLLLLSSTTSGEDEQGASSSTKSATDSTGGINTDMDADEREDALSNALANCIANYTPGSNVILSLSNKMSWLENDDTLRQLLMTYGATEPTTTSSASTTTAVTEDLLHNYDLAYNLGTYLLVSSESRSRSQLLQAKNLLEHAEISALTIFDSSSASATTTTTDEEEKNTTVTEGGGGGASSAAEKARLQQLHLAEREANPIRANLALSKVLLGGSANEMDALRTYLTLVTKSIANKSKGAKKGAAAAVEGNLLAIASNNLAVLRDEKESVFDVLKRIPMTSSLSVSEDGPSESIASRKGGKEKASGTMVPLVGATPQQVRTALYNRALLFAKMGNVTGCLEVLSVLRASLLVSYHGDEREKNKSMNDEGLSTIGSSPKRTKGKKKKNGSTVVATASSGEIEKKDVPTAKPASDEEMISWIALTNLLESELYRKSESKDVSPNDILDNAIAKLENMASNNNARNDDDDNACLGVLPYTTAQLMLHRAVVNNPTPQSKDAIHPFIESLESLPTSMKSCPGVAMTLASLHASSSHNQKNGTVEKILSSLGDESLAKLATAEFHMARRQYDAAATLLQAIVDENEGNDSDDASLSLEAMALLVKALSYTDPQKAEEYAALLQEAIGVRSEGELEGGPQLNGEMLESMDIPRFAKKAADTSTRGREDQGGSSLKVRKLIAATGGKGRSNMG